MGRWSWARISRPPSKRFLNKSDFPHHLINTLPGSPEIVKNFGLGTYVQPHTNTKDPAVQKGGRVVRLSLGRRLVNLLPVAQRTNALANGVVDRRWVVGREFKSHVHHEKNAFYILWQAHTLYQIDSSMMGTHQLHLAWFTYNCCTESYTPPPVDLAPIPHLLLCKFPELFLVLDSMWSTKHWSRYWRTGGSAKSGENRYIRTTNRQQNT